MNFLITGGAGYIGSHIGELLLKNKHNVRIYDDFSNGLHRRIKDLFTDVINANILDENNLDAAMANIDVVIHLAGKKAVGESVKFPVKYYENNVIGSKKVLDSMRRNGVKKIIFSSTAVVYLPNQDGIFSESDHLGASSPYGENKIEVENILSEYCKNYQLSSFSLRYFNVVGASTPQLSDNSIENLVPKVFKALKNEIQPEIYGNDYPTKDGTCIRDYIHISDLSDLHLELINKFNIGENQIFNIGSGSGYSVKEVFETIDRTCGLVTNPKVVGRRSGDVPKLVANISKVLALTKWQPKRTLQEMVKSAWEGWQFSMGDDL